MSMPTIQIALTKADESVVAQVIKAIKDYGFDIRKEDPSELIVTNDRGIALKYLRESSVVIFLALSLADEVGDCEKNLQDLLEEYPTRIFFSKACDFRERLSSFVTQQVKPNNHFPRRTD